MPSKYDDYWNNRMDDIQALLDQVEKISVSNKLNVYDIQSYGTRDSWYGIAILYDNKILNRKPMAHIKSLVGIIKKHKLIKNNKIHYIIQISRDLNLKISKMNWRAHKQAGAISYEEVAILEEILPILFSYVEKRNDYKFLDEELCKWINNNINYLYAYIEDRGKSRFKNEYPDKHIINIRNSFYHLSAPKSFWIETINLPHKKINPLEKISQTYYELKKNWREIVGFTEIKEQKQINEFSKQLEIQNVFNPNNLEDARNKILRSIVERRGQSKFRETLIQSYKGKCAITRCDAISALEAAHIMHYKGDSWNHPTNGILLRADIHTLYDLKLLTIDPESFKVILSNELKQSSYNKYNSVDILLPDKKEFSPSREALEDHFKDFMKMNS